MGRSNTQEMKQIGTTIALAAIAASAVAATKPANLKPDSILPRVERNDGSTQRLVSLAWHNPAMRPLERDFSISSVSGSFNRNADSEAIDPQVGSKSTRWAFAADSYIKYKNSTLWGSASYHNGKDRDVKWNETSEIWNVYPYVMGDSTGGDIKTEVYSFAGGYAATCGRLTWGCSMGYTAGLYYRAVDPRPRNVTGNLEFAAGITWNFTPDTYAGVMLGYTKYKQTNDITFYSELGDKRILHLTGLVNDYGRFAGDATSAYYNGNTWRAGLNLGLAGSLKASVEALHYKVTNILTSLNKLPMAFATHNAINAEAAWTSTRWGAAAQMSASRRVGTENVFGDAASSTYPKIAEHDQYFENRIEASARGMYSIKARQVEVRLLPAVGYSHRNEIYRDPRCRELINTAWGKLQAEAGIKTGKALLTVSALGAFYGNTTHQLMLSGTKDEMKLLEQLMQRRHALKASDYWTAGAELRADVALWAKYALLLKVQWQRTAYTQSVNNQQLAFTAGVVF